MQIGLMKSSELMFSLIAGHQVLIGIKRNKDMSIDSLHSGDGGVLVNVEFDLVQQVALNDVHQQTRENHFSCLREVCCKA